MFVSMCRLGFLADERSNGGSNTTGASTQSSTNAYLRASRWHTVLRSKGIITLSSNNRSCVLLFSIICSILAHDSNTCMMTIVVRRWLDRSASCPRDDGDGSGLVVRLFFQQYPFERVFFQKHL